MLNQRKKLEVSEIQELRKDKKFAKIKNYGIKKDLKTQNYQIA
jgi:hypothetical protein